MATTSNPPTIRISPSSSAKSNCMDRWIEYQARSAATTLMKISSTHHGMSSPVQFLRIGLMKPPNKSVFSGLTTR